MRPLSELFENNKQWAESIKRSEPEFFSRLARAQKPKYFWIGCSDSRVPAEDIVGAAPGEMFVHRNIANVVIHTDLNCLSVLQFAVEMLSVGHIILCGHTDCGGIRAAMQHRSFGLIDNWLLELKDLYGRHAAELEAIHDDGQRLDRLCELNVYRQVANICETSIVQGAWERQQTLTVHGLMYDMAEGLLRDIQVSVSGPGGIEPIYRLNDPAH